MCGKNITSMPREILQLKPMASVFVDPPVHSTPGCRPPALGHVALSPSRIAGIAVSTRASACHTVEGMPQSPISRSRAGLRVCPPTHRAPLRTRICGAGSHHHCCRDRTAQCPAFWCPAPSPPHRCAPGKDPCGHAPKEMNAPALISDSATFCCTPRCRSVQVVRKSR